MTRLLTLYDATAAGLEAAAPWLIPTLARLVFAGVLLVYYLNSGLSKFGDGLLGLFRPDAGAYVTIFPKAMEAVGYDVSQLTIFHWAVTLAGTWAEVLLPVAIVISLVAVDLREAIPALDLPLLAIHGAESRVYAPETGAWIAEHAPQGAVTVLPGCGHAPNLEDPVAVAEAIARFAALA